MRESLTRVVWHRVGGQAMAGKIPKEVLDAHAQCIIEPYETMANARRRAREELDQLWCSIEPTPQRRSRRPSGRSAIATETASVGAGAHATTPASAAVEEVGSTARGQASTTCTKQHGGRPCRQGGGQPRKRRVPTVVAATSETTPMCEAASVDTRGEETQDAGTEAVSSRQGTEVRPCDHVALGDSDAIVPKRRKWASDTVRMQDGKFVIVKQGNVAVSSQNDVPSEGVPKKVEPIEVAAIVADGVRQCYNKGDAVMLVGLKSSSLNGKIATVKCYHEAIGRWIVQVPGMPRQSNVKPENLELFCRGPGTLPRFKRSSNSSSPLTCTVGKDETQQTAIGPDASSVAGPVLSESELDESGDLPFSQTLESQPSQHAASDIELDVPLVSSCFPPEHAAALAPKEE